MRPLGPNTAPHITACQTREQTKLNRHNSLMYLLVFFYILPKIIQGYDSHFVCARVTVFSGARQQNFAGADLLCTIGAFDLKMCQQNL
jgi:hypothetical protein